MTYRILAIDGGGIRGAFALQVLKMLLEDVDEKLFDKIDCLAGTSTGSLIATAVTQGFSPKELIRFYKYLGRVIFSKNPHFKEKGAKYRNNFLRMALNKVYSKDLTLSDIEKDLIIPSCRLCSKGKGMWDWVIYDNYDREKAKEYNVVDVALRSSAAPLYFPSYQQHVDGGVYALNPSLVALSRAIDKSGGNKNFSDIRILSIGNGINPSGINQEIDWNEKQWMQPYHNVAKYPLFALLTDIGATIPEYPLQQLLQEKYYRINGMLPTPIEIDDFKKVPKLIESAKAIREYNPEKWEEAKKWVRENFLI